MFILLAFLGVATVGLAAFWNDIRDFVLDLARNWVRETFGEWAEDLLVEAVVKLDFVISRSRRFVRRRVLARTENRSQATLVSVEEVPLEDLPEEMQEELEDAPLEHHYQS